MFSLFGSKTEVDKNLINKVINVCDDDAELKKLGVKELDYCLTQVDNKLKKIKGFKEVKEKEEKEEEEKKKEQAQAQAQAFSTLKLPPLLSQSQPQQIPPIPPRPSRGGRRSTKGARRSAKVARKSTKGASKSAKVARRSTKMSRRKSLRRQK
jgi:hypothetical protein